MSYCHCDRLVHNLTTGAAAYYIHVPIDLNFHMEFK